MPTGILVPRVAEDVASFATRVEELGYDTLWSGELWGRDVFVALTEAATVTEEIGLGPAIANVYGRSPATLAQAAASLHDASDGRARLGLGTSTRKAVEDLHGVPFERPARRLHETVQLAKEFLTGEGRVAYDGELFQTEDFPPLGADVPVYAASLGRATRRATGRTADGWIPHTIPFDRLDDAFGVIADAADEAGRDPDTFYVAPYVPAAVDEDPEAARAAIRSHVAYYVGSGEGYRRAVAQHFPDAADAIATAWQSGDREEARAAVTDEMIDGLGVAGDPDAAREQLANVADLAVIDEPIIVIPGVADVEMTDETVRALAPSGG